MLQSLQPTCGRHGVSRKQTLVSSATEIWGCLLPQHDLAYSDCSSHFYLQGPKWSNLYLPGWPLPPSLFLFLTLLCSIFTILEHTSFIPSSGSLHCIRCFIATSFHVPSLHTDLWWNLLVREGPDCISKIAPFISLSNLTLFILLYASVSPGYFMLCL